MEEHELRQLLQLSLRPEAVKTLQPVLDFVENDRDRKVEAQLSVGGRSRWAQVKVYWQDLFREICAAKGITTDDIEECVCKAPLVTLGSLGKSGSTIYLSSGREFVIKTLPKDELRYFCTRFEAYHQHIVASSQSFLPTFLGLYRFRMRGRRLYVMISNSVFPSGVSVEQIFDLKGSTSGREATEEERASGMCIFKDNDFLAESRPLHMGTKQVDVLSTLERDVRFLSNLNIMDYSLLLVYTKQSNSEEGKVTPIPMAAKHMLWNTHQHNGTVIYFGIIDVFCAYTMKKRVARTFKVLTGQPARGLSTIPADIYATRFVEFMRDHVFV